MCPINIESSSCPDILEVNLTCPYKKYKADQETLACVNAYQNTEAVAKFTNCICKTD